MLPGGSSTRVGMKRMPQFKSAAEADPYPELQGSGLASAGTAAAGLGTVAGLGSLAAKPIATRLHDTVRKHLPIDPGLAGRLAAYRQGVISAGKDPGQLMSAYV